MSRTKDLLFYVQKLLFFLVRRIKSQPVTLLQCSCYLSSSDRFNKIEYLPQIHFVLLRSGEFVLCSVLDTSRNCETEPIQNAGEAQVKVNNEDTVKYLSR